MRRHRQSVATGGNEAGLLKGFGRRSARTQLPPFAPAVFQTLSTASPASAVVTSANIGGALGRRLLLERRVRRPPRGVQEAPDERHRHVLRIVAKLRDRHASSLLRRRARVAVVAPVV